LRRALLRKGRRGHGRRQQRHACRSLQTRRFAENRHWQILYSNFGREGRTVAILSTAGRYFSPQSNAFQTALSRVHVPLRLLLFSLLPQNH
jgi:hypothetical protein